MSERLIKTRRIIPAFDKRSDDPKKNYGVGSEIEHYAVVGEIGAVSFSFSTGRFLPHVANEFKPGDIDRLYPLGHGVDYHFYKCPVEWKEYASPADNCPLLNGKACYCDGSALAGDDFMRIYEREGEAGVYAALTMRYEDAKRDYAFVESDGKK